MNTLGSSIKGQIKLFTSGIYAFFMLPEKNWGAYSRHAVRTSVRPKPFLHNPWTKFYESSYLNSLEQCADFPVSRFEAASRKRRA